jgi:hypothetical protein
MWGGSRILENQVQERDSVKKKNQISSDTNKTLHCKKPNSLKLFHLFLTCEMILRGCINQIALAPFSLTNGNFTNGWRISHNKRGTMYADIVQFSQREKTAWVWTHIVHLHQDELQENTSKGETCCGLRKEKGYTDYWPEIGMVVRSSEECVQSQKHGWQAPLQPTRAPSSPTKCQ